MTKFLSYMTRFAARLDLALERLRLLRYCGDHVCVTFPGEPPLGAPKCFGAKSSRKFSQVGSPAKAKQDGVDTHEMFLHGVPPVLRGGHFIRRTDRKTGEVGFIYVEKEDSPPRGFYAVNVRVLSKSRRIDRREKLARTRKKRVVKRYQPTERRLKTA